ncbi:MAG: 50S ribosomal protein L15 [Deltaproteobacteria bacterium]|nr:50S ribosomal protein L15 [Deltaproteobacteria bacterium]
MELSKLSPGKGSRKAKKRLGRGEGSGAGKTSGRGEKGQGARSGGKVHAWFEGGQMPLYRRIPKLGFKSRKKNLGLNIFNLVNLDVLEQFESGQTVDAAALAVKGVGLKSKNRAGLKILGRGEITKKLTVKAQAVSATAKAKIEAAGGNVEIVRETV